MDSRHGLCVSWRRRIAIGRGRSSFPRRSRDQFRLHCCEEGLVRRLSRRS